MDRGYVSRSEVVAMQRKIVMELLRSQLPDDMLVAYGQVADRHREPIDAAARRFKQGVWLSRENARKSLTGKSGEVMDEAFKRLGDTSYESFNAGVNSIRHSDFRPSRPLFGLPPQS